MTHDEAARQALAIIEAARVRRGQRIRRTRYLLIAAWLAVPITWGALLLIGRLMA